MEHGRWNKLNELELTYMMEKIDYLYIPTLYFIAKYAMENSFTIKF